MLHLTAKGCTNILLKYDAIESNQQNIYIYGFELLFSTIMCISFILFWGIMSGHRKLVVTFLFFFVPIRTVAGGCHAKTYGDCFLLTNFIAASSVLTAKHLWIHRNVYIDWILWVLFLAVFGYIWIKSPVISKKYPWNLKKAIKNKRYAHIMLILEGTVILTAKFYLHDIIFYMAVVTSVIVAAMMKIAEEEYKHENNLDSSRVSCR